MQHFRSKTATVIELLFFMKKKKKMKKKMKNLRKLYFIPGAIFSCIQLLFYMFSTLMSLKDRLRLKLNVKTNCTMYGYNAGPPTAIPIYSYKNSSN